MNKFRFLIFLLGFSASLSTLQSCIDDDDSVDPLSRPTALVTVRPLQNNSFELQLDNTTKLRPTNMSSSPFGNKEVRALVNYTEEGGNETENVRNVHINWIDSIRTKKPVPSLGDENDAKYGNDAIEIVRDWVTIAEDGYLTLRIRTLWGISETPHVINLLTGVNPDNPYELELRHDAKGDAGFRMGDALIAFNLNDLPRGDNSEIKITLKWRSFYGNKSADFDLYLHPISIALDLSEKVEYNRFVR